MLSYGTPAPTKPAGSLRTVSRGAGTCAPLCTPASMIPAQGDAVKTTGSGGSTGAGAKRCCPRPVCGRVFAFGQMLRYEVFALFPIGRWKRQRARTGRGPDAGRTIEFEGTDADRTRAWPFLPGGPVGQSTAFP
eukprot:gene4715-biopygen8480